MNPDLASFELLCRCLAPQGTQASGLRQQLVSGEVHWESLVQQASAHYVTPSLYRALCRKGLDSTLPADLRDYLETIAALNDARNRRHYEALISILQSLNAIGVQPLPLKGALALLPGRYDDADARILGDLDLLVPPDRVEDCARALQARGYAYCYPTWFYADVHHTAPLVHAERQVTVELHRELTHKPLRPVLGAAEMWSRSTLQGHAGVAYRVPQLDLRLLHNFIHAQIAVPVRRLWKPLELRQLYEFVRLQDLPGESVDWLWLRERVDRYALGHAFRAYLLAAEHWLGQAFPGELDATARARRTHRRLRAQLAHPPLRRALRLIERLLLFAPKRLLAPSWYRKRLYFLTSGRRL